MSRIRSTVHNISSANTGKKKILSSFINEYRRVAGLIVSDIWNNGYKQGDIEFNIKDNKLYFPRYVDYTLFNIETTLSARALSSLTTQISGIIKASTEKQRKRIYMLGVLKKEGKSRCKRKTLIKRIKQNIPQMPNCKNINPELSSKCAEFIEVNGAFNGFLHLRSITKNRIGIKLPILYTKQSNKFKRLGGVLASSFLITPNSISLKWKMPDIVKKANGIVVGADQGYKDVLTMSDKQITPKTDVHGHSLESIITKMSRQKRGGVAFRKSQNHRVNFINWSINQLNLNGVKELRLEQIWNIGYKNKTTRKLAHWSNPLIRDKVEQVCEDAGVQLKHQSSTYRSQRCSGCGVVRKANRKGKTYSCKHCGLIIDADFNAALNHEIDLPEIPYVMRKSKINRGNGFYWLENGFYDFGTGRSLESLHPVESKVEKLS